MAVITSVEHDHIDIYPDEASYVAAFRAFLERIPAGGLVVVDASQALAREVQGPAIVRCLGVACATGECRIVGRPWAGPGRRGRRKT